MAGWFVCLVACTYDIIPLADHNLHYPPRLSCGFPFACVERVLHYTHLKLPASMLAYTVKVTCPYMMLSGQWHSFRPVSVNLGLVHIFVPVCPHHHMLESGRQVYTGILPRISRGKCRVRCFSAAVPEDSAEHLT
jgi:hypothetical protein